VLKVCIGRGPWNKTSLLGAMEHAFEHELGDKVASQLVLAFNSVIRLGKDQAKFNEVVMQMYGTALKAALVDGLFEAYAACSSTSPNYLSKSGKKKGKTRSKPAAKRKDHLGESSMSEGQTDVDFSEASLFLDFLQVPISCPGSLDRQCHKCHKNDLHGWKRSSGGLFWCVACLKEHISNKGFVDEDMPKPSAHPGGPGGPALRFDALPRLTSSTVAGSSCNLPTEVRVVRSCCLAEAQRVVRSCCLAEAQDASSRAVLLVHGRELGPLAEHKHGQGGTVVRASMLQQAVRESRGAKDMHPLPRWGGIYVPNVLVTKNGKEQDLKEPFRVAMVYASATVMADGTQTDEKTMVGFRAEMWKKVLNVLRMCHAKQHDELVLGAWGCQWRGAPREEVAAIFRAALFDSDLSGVFRRVTFAIQGTEDDALVFENEFRPYLP